MVRRSVFALVLLGYALGMAASAKPVLLDNKGAIYKITPLYSNVSFSIMKFFFKEEGGFSSYSGTIFYDPARPEASHVSMTVEAASIDTRNNNRDATLRSDDFFDTKRYPTLSFESVLVTAKRQDEFEITGDLTIHGITKRITIPVRFLGAKQLPGWGYFVGFDTVFTVDRTAFGVNGSRWSAGRLILSNEVTIHLAIGAVRE